MRSLLSTLIGAAVLLCAAPGSAQIYFGSESPECTFAAGSTQISIAGDPLRTCGAQAQGALAKIKDAAGAADCLDVPGAAGGGAESLLLQWDDSLGGAGEWKCPPAGSAAGTILVRDEAGAVSDSSVNTIRVTDGRLSINAAGDVSIDASGLLETVVSALPGSPTSVFLYVITDGGTALDCTVGGESGSPYRVLCGWTGAVWRALGITDLKDLPQDGATDGQSIVWNNAANEWQAGSAAIVIASGSIPFGTGVALSEDNANLFWDDTNKRLGIGTNTPSHTLEVHGDVEIVHLAVDSDDHALEIDVDAAGFGDVKAVNINYITGPISTGEVEAVILVDINEIGAGGGEVIALAVLATEGGADNLYAVKAGALIGPVIQDSGVFINPTTGTNNTVATNVPAMIDGNTGTNTTVFLSDNDYVLIGSVSPFTEIAVVINTPASGSGVAPVFAYSIAGAHEFTDFSPLDSTNGFRNTGVIAWDASDLVDHVANDDTSTFDIRITRTRNNVTSPNIFFVKSVATVVFSWDKDGNLIVNSINEAAIPAEISRDSELTAHAAIPDAHPEIADKTLNVMAPPTGSGLSIPAANGIIATDRLGFADGNGQQSPQDLNAFVPGSGTDDADEITAAINYACNNGYDTVYIPEGIYRIGDPLVGGFNTGIKIDAEVCGTIRLIGAGAEATILLANFESGGTIIAAVDRDEGDFNSFRLGANVWGDRAIGIVEGFSNATPPVVDLDSDGGLRTGDTIHIRNCSGMTGINGNVFTVANADTAEPWEFELQDAWGNDVDGTTIGTWTAGPNACIMAGLHPDFHLEVAHMKFEDDAPYAHMQWDFVQDTFVDGDVDTGANTVTVTGHPFVDDQGPLRLRNIGGTLPGGLLTATDYFVNVTGDDLGFSLSSGGADVDITSAAGGGTHNIEDRNEMQLLSEESHGVSAYVTGGDIWIHDIDLEGLGDESIDLSPTESQILIERTACRAPGKHCITVAAGNGITIRDNYMYANAQLYADTFLVGTATLGPGTGGGQGISLEGGFKNWQVRGVEIYGNTIEGQFSGGIGVNVAVNGFDGHYFKDIDIHGNTININPKAEYCDEIGETCFGFRVDQRTFGLENIYFHENFVRGEVLYQSDTFPLLDAVRVESNIIRPMEFVSSAGVSVRGHASVIADNDIKGFTGFGIFLQPKEVTDAAVDATTFVDGDVDVGGDFVTIADHLFRDEDGPIQLTTSGTLPGGLATATDYFVFVDGDDVSFSLEINGSIIDITSAAGGGTHTMDLEHHVVSVTISGNRVVGAGNSAANTLIGMSTGAHQRAHWTDEAHLDISDNYFKVTAGATANRVMNLVNGSFANLEIRDNVIEVDNTLTGMQYAITVSEPRGTKITGNTVTGPIEGIFAGQSALPTRDVLIADNTFDLFGALHGIRVFSSKNVRITGNSVSRTSDSGIYLTYQEDGLGWAIVTGNQTFDTFRGLEVECTSSCVTVEGMVITGNEFDLDGALNGEGVLLDDTLRAIVSQNICLNTNDGTFDTPCVDTQGASDHNSVFGNISGWDGVAGTGAGGFEFGTVGGGLGCSTTGAGANSICGDNLVE